MLIFFVVVLETKKLLIHLLSPARYTKVVKIIIIIFILIQEKGFTKSLLNWKTFTSPNSAQLPFLYVITQTLETVNVNLELDYLYLLKWYSII